MKIIKRIVLGLVILIVLLLAAAIAVPFLFKDKIMALAKTEMNKQLNAKADFSDVDISLLRNFPRLSISITGLSIVGIDQFEGDTLVAAESINVAVELMKAIKGDYEILNIGLDKPRIHAIVLEDGHPNWDIAKPSPETPAGTPDESAPFAMKLRKYAIENGYIEYDDRQGKMHLVIVNLNHSGSGDFTSDAFTLSTKTTADAITYAMGGVPYLNKVKTSIDLDLGIDNKNSKYSFNTDKIQLNGLRLYTKGFVQMPDTNNIVMDIQYGTPSNDFKDILSLVPGIYQADFKDIKTTGKLALSGFVKGTYNAKQMPAYMVNLAIENGSFQYPALPQKVSDIQVKLRVVNPDGITDHTVVDLEKCHLALGAEPFDLRMLLKTPVTNQWIDASAKGHVNLANMGQFIAMEAGTKMSGEISADVAVKGSMAEAQKKQFGNLDANGTIDIRNFSYVSKDYPDGVSIASLLLTFNPRNVTVANLKGQYMKTNFSGEGSVDNLLGYTLNNEALSGRFSFAADQVDVNKFMGTPSSATPETTAAPATDPFLVPANLDVDLKATVGTLKYDNIVMTAVNGALGIHDQTVTLKDVSGRALDGTLKMSGSYSTKNNKKNPAIAFDYSVQNVDVQKTVAAFDMVQKMMPSAKYASGRVTSNLSMTGRLNGDMTPDVNTLSGKGDLMLLSGQLSGYPVTDQLADKLKLQQLKKVELQDMKLFFSFKDGRVTVEPYKTKIGKDIDAEIAGSHGFDQTMSYGVNLVVPRALLGSAGNAVVNDLVSKAAGKGIPINVGDKINFTVKIGGTTMQPKIETDLKSQATDAINNIKDEIKKEVQHKVDSVKTVVKDTVKAIKDKAVEEAKKEVKDEIKKQLTGQGGDDKKPGEKVKDAAEKAKEGLKGLFKKR